MRTLPTGLQAHLDTGATTLCWCWKLLPPEGAPQGFTDHDGDLAFGGVTYEAEAGFTGSTIHSALGLAVDNLDVAGALQSDRLDAAKLAAGDYDNAGIEIWLVNWQDVSQRLLLRKGHLGEVTHGPLGFSAEMRGLAHLLNQPKGRLFQYGCDAVLGDARCTVDLDDAAYRGEGVVTASEDDRRFTVSGLNTFEENWFARGQLTYTSGGNAGRRMEMKAHRTVGSAVIVETWQPAVAPVMAGDEFTVTAGCDKQFATCRAKFANQVNFRGFPHMPGNDFVTSYPNRDDVGNDGTSRS
ncbi:DUF2163 domain-containing protein [soil metagenome]